MIIAYHAIFTTYGTWLPNDPRGSYSKEIYNDQLRMLGRIKYGRQNPIPAKERLMKFWTTAAPRISRPPLFFDDRSRSITASAFSTVVQRLGIKVPACAIMNDHIHILLLRSKYRIEYLVNQFKGAATSALKLKYTPWTRGCWKVFITDAESLLAAVKYIQANPAYSGLPVQSWDFVSPLNV
jgi:REP element-mobilizing transposase RayT